MFAQNFKNVGKMEYYTSQQLSITEAKQYAIQQIQKSCKKGSNVGEVYVNGKLVLENVKVS